MLMAVLPLFSVYALFRKWLNLKYSILLSLITGFFVVPLVLLLLGVVGIPISFVLQLIVTLIVFGSGFALNGHVTLKNDWNHVVELFSNLKENWTKLILPVFFLILLFLVLYLRFANTNVNNFFEFDPYYYMHVTELLVKQGTVPAYSLDSNYPTVRPDQVPMFVSYMTGGWLLNYNEINGGGFDKDNLIYASNFYPPLAAVLLAVSLFLLFSVLGSDYLGFFVAGFFMVQPQLIQKMAAGVNETQPFGMFATVWTCALFIVALHFKSLRLAIVAGLSVLINILASAQALWPLSAISIFGILIALFSLFSSKDFKKELLIYGIICISSLVGSIIFSWYYSQPISWASYQLLFLIGLVLSGCSLLLNSKFQSFKQNKKLFYGLIGLLVILFFITPAFGKLLGFSTSALGVAKTTVPLQKTIAEQAPSSPEFLQQVYGTLNPFTAIKVITFVLIAFASLLLGLKKKWYYGFALFAVISFPLFFNSSFDTVINSSFSGVLPQNIIDFLTNGDVFIYFILSLISLLVISIFDKHEFLPLLLLVLLSMPVLYIGTGQVKYIVHASLALLVFSGFGLIVISRAIAFVFTEFNWGALKELSLLKYLSLIAIFFLVILQVNNAFNVSSGLKGSLIYQDWLDAMNYLKTGVSDAYCNQKFGDDCRVLSWWDYGHWTVFFGEKKTVIDPGNLNQDYNQETARAYVDGKDSDMTYVIKKHHVTHILVDADLIQKWGALVFLSGSCNKNMSQICPEIPDIANWEQGPGKSKYEYQHYFEYIQTSNQFCPGDGFTKENLFKSGFGIPYCFNQQAQTYSVPTSQGNLFERSYTQLQNVPVGQEGSEPDYSKSIMVGYDQTQILNLNPDLRSANMTSRLINSAFVRMFFFKKYPGVKLVYESPNRLIKIFEVQDETYQKQTLAEVKAANGIN